MIPKATIVAYLERAVSDHRPLKKWTNRKINEKLLKRFPDFKGNSCLRLHQKICIYLGLRFPRFSFWVDMGGGKTLISLELLRYWWEKDCIRKALVFVISDKAFLTWERQVTQYGIDIPFLTLDAGNSADNWAALRSYKSGLVFLTYPTVVAMVSRQGKSDEDEFKSSIEDILEGVDAIVMDESTRVGHITSLSHRILKALTKDLYICYALSGRPFGRDPTLLWGQQYIVDRGASLGSTLGIFREAFFNSERPGWVKNKLRRLGRRALRAHRLKHKKDFTFRQSMMRDLRRLMQHRSITYRENECTELPLLVPVVETVHLPEEAEAYYRRVVQQIISAKGNYQEMQNAFIRIRQLSSGFLGFKDEENDERVEVEFDENPKMDRLMELLEDLPEDRGAVVFYEFTFSGRKITQQLRERGISCVWLWSGTKNSRKSLELFMSGKRQVAVIQNKVGAYSLDGLQHVANYTFFYESPVSAIDREQAERRLRRDGQEHKVFQYDLVVEGTLDQRILDYHAQGREMFRVLTKDPTKFFIKRKRHANLG